MIQTAAPKHQLIRDDLTRAIREGQYGAGQRLPTERELASQYGVHRMTIRQATSSLVKAGLVVRRRPSGVFVRDDIPGEVRWQAINLICPATDAAHSAVFIDAGRRLAEAAGYRPRLLRHYPGAERATIEALTGPDPSVLLQTPAQAGDELALALSRCADRVVSLGCRLDHLGVRSILADDAAGMHLAVSHLLDQGHDQLAVLCSEPGRHNTVQSEQIALAQGVMTQAGRDPSDLRVVTIRDHATSSALRAGRTAMLDLMRRYDRLPFSALIGLSEGVTNGALSACYRKGLRIPDDISALVYAGTHRCDYALPPQTRIDVRIDAHLRAAFDWLNEPFVPANDPSDAAVLLLRRIQPRLVVRESVSDANSTRHAGAAG